MNKLLAVTFFIFSVGVQAQTDTGTNVPVDSMDVNAIDSLVSEDVERDFNGAIDTVSISKRPFSQNTIDSLKRSDDFNYQQPPTVAESIWQRIKRWLAEFFGALLEGAMTPGIGRILMYVIGVILLSALVMMLLKVNAFKVFYSGADTRPAGGQFFEENIHEMDFEKLIATAASQQDYRQATRLVLLYALKLLSDRNLIHWQTGKTNHDYVQELTSGEIKTGLNELSFYFDYAWYGNFSINPDTYRKVEETFSDLRRKIN